MPANEALGWAMVFGTYAFVGLTIVFLPYITRACMRGALIPLRVAERIEDLRGR